MISFSFMFNIITRKTLKKGADKKQVFKVLLLPTTFFFKIRNALINCAEVSSNIQIFNIISY